jgi:hypothetical protein
MRSGRFDRWVTGAVLGAIALAGTAGTAIAGPNSGKVAFSAGYDFTTAYFFRGILQERRGLIMQPYGEINVNLYADEEGPVTGFTLIGGMWNSLHMERTLSDGDGPDNWYEADIYGGAKLTLLNKIDLKGLYIAYTYPNGAFATVQELDFSVGLNDSEWLGAFAMYPSLLWAVEVDNTALGQNMGRYLELNVRPSFTIVESETYPVSLAFPMQVGLSAGNYYEKDADSDETFGFFKGGFVVSMPLAFIPADYGAFSVSAGASIYTFGQNLQDFNEEDDPWVVGTWSINWAY